MYSKAHEVFMRAAVAADGLPQRMAVDESTVLNGMIAATDILMTFVRGAINFVVVPGVCIFLVAILAVQIASCVHLHRAQQGYSDKIVPIVVTFVVLVLIGTIPLWLWTAVGMTSSGSETAAAVSSAAAAVGGILR